MSQREPFRRASSTFRMIVSQKQVQQRGPLQPGLWLLEPHLWRKQLWQRLRDSYRLAWQQVWVASLVLPEVQPAWEAPAFLA